MPRRPESKPATTAGRASGRRPSRGSRGSGGVPTKSSFRSILIRSVIFAAVLYALLVYVAGDPPGAALLLVLVFFVLSIPLGIFFDRMRYRAQLRRFERRRAGG